MASALSNTPHGAERPSSCGSCRNFDSVSSECRAAPPSFVVSASGLVTGWLLVQAADVCASYAARIAPPPACRGRGWFCDLPGHDGRRGLCRGSPPLQPLDNTGRPTGRTGSWPPVAATAWCGSHAPAAPSREEAA